MYKDIFKEVLITYEQIVERAKELGKQLSKDYANKMPIFVGVLKGCIPFFAELLKHLECDLEIDFVDVSSFDGGVKSTGVLTVNHDVRTSVKGRNVVIVDDIIDSGLSLSHLVKHFKEEGAKEVKLVCMLDKSEGRLDKKFQADYVGFVIPNKFVVGFGLDYMDLYRNINDIGVLKEEIYQEEGK